MRNRVVHGLAAVLALASSPILTAGGGGPLSAGVERIMAYLGFDKADLGALMEGKIISTELQEGSDKQLAVSVAVLVPATVGEVTDAVRRGRTFAVGRDVIEYQPLSDGPPSEGDFAGLGYVHDEIKEVQKLLKVKAGSDFNLSKVDINRFRELARRMKGTNARKDPSVRGAVNAQLRAILLDRYRAYRKDGVAAIAAYDRGGKKKAEPADELALAFRQDAILPDELKSIERAFQSYPKEGAEDIENRFYWVKQRVQSRPAFILAHQMIQFRPDGALMVERQFYVQHNYNSLQIVVGCVPVEDGTVVFYRNRTFTDQVAGFGSGMKHDIGRGQMRKAIEDHFEAMRRALREKK